MCLLDLGSVVMLCTGNFDLSLLHENFSWFWSWTFWISRSMSTDATKEGGLDFWVAKALLGRALEGSVNVAL